MGTIADPYLAGAIPPEVEQYALRAADLDDLQRQGVRFDFGEEIERLGQMPEYRYRRELSKVRERYARGPIHPALRVGGEDLSHEQMQEVVRYAKRHGIDNMSEAVERYRAEPEPMADFARADLGPEEVSRVVRFAARHQITDPDLALERYRRERQSGWDRRAW